jgi:hypothetical protein
LVTSYVHTYPTDWDSHTTRQTTRHDTQQKAEFFYLKAEFLAKLGFGEDANGAYSTAVSTWDGLGRGWAGWGSFCEAMHAAGSASPPLLRAHQQQQPQPQAETAAAGSKDASSVPRQPHSWVEFALICFLQAMRAQPALSESLVPRVLLLLCDQHDQQPDDTDQPPQPAGGQQQQQWQEPSSPAAAAAAAASTSSSASGAAAAAAAAEEPAGAGTAVAEPETWEKQLAGTFDTFSENVPMWVWIPWLPQLLAALSRPEGVQLKGVLAKLASLYPQAVYYPLRNFIFEQRLLAYSRSRKKTQLLEAAAAAAAAVHSTGSSEQQQAPPVALQEQPPPPVKEEGDPGTSAQADDKKKRQGLLFGEEVMSIMKNSFPAVVAKMEEMVKEITKCVTISTEERLLQVLAPPQAPHPPTPSHPQWSIHPTSNHDHQAWS